MLSVELPVRQPFDAPGIFAFLSARAVPGIETADLTEPNHLVYARTLILPSGPAAIRICAYREVPAGWTLRGDLELSCAQDEAAAVFRLQRLLDLEADSRTIDAALAQDPCVSPSVMRTPGIRVPGAVDPHELVIRAIIGQQISVKSARTHLARLIEHSGTAYSSGFEGLDRLFPNSRSILDSVEEPAAEGPLDPQRILRLPRRSLTTLRGAARALESGELVVDFDSDPALLQQSLVQSPGIGPWTAAYLAMRVLGDPDAWMRRDVALVAGATRLGILEPQQSKNASHRTLEEHARRWAPWRSYASMHLWQAAAA